MTSAYCLAHGWTSGTRATMTEKRKVRRVVKDKTSASSEGTSLAEVQETGAVGSKEPPKAEAKEQGHASGDRVGRPTGTIPTNLKIAFGRGYPWANVTRDADLHEKYGNPYGIAAMLMAMEVIETGGRMIWNTGGSGAYGIMQIKESDWGWLAEKIGASLQSREGQIAVAAAILGREGKGSNPRERFLYSYYPVLDKKGNICLTCKGEDGGTPQQYLDDIDTLVKIINAAAVTTPAPVYPETPPQRPATPADVIRVILGGKSPTNSDFGFGEYNYDNNGKPLNYYDYGPGHGPGLVADNQHPGIDIMVPLGTTLYAPLAGVVRCVGSAGSADYGQGCGAYPDYLTGGLGNLTIKTDDGLVYRFGHVNKILVKLGQRVTVGQPVATSGGMNSPHMHLETSLDRPDLVDRSIAHYPGGYWMTPPLEEIAARMDNVNDTRPMVVFAGASVAVPLDVPYRYVEIPKTQTNQRPGIKMIPDRYVQHETGNYSPGMGAAAHVRYLQQGAPDDNGRSQQLSYHLTVDHLEVAQCIPFDEVTWQGGDGRGKCNYNGISCEASVSDNNKFKIGVRDNAEQVAAAAMEAKGLEILQQHSTCCSDAKVGCATCHCGCPESIIKDGYWPTFTANVDALRGGVNPSDPVPTYPNAIPTPAYDGYDKVVNGHMFYALNRKYKAKRAGVVAYQYADKTSKPLRAPLAMNEEFEGKYVTEGSDGLPWIVTMFDSRIPMADVDPSFEVHDA